MYVFAFDRDWTVDVNPHPKQTAVPLEWVRYLAHETEHAVYAIGNQDLADEAAIPGVVDVVGRHDDHWDDWLGAKQPDGRYRRFPTRRERLALIQDLHPDADAYVVVDDIDLSDVDTWRHYHAWEFVPAVERGDLDPELPWVDDAVADDDPEREREAADDGDVDLDGDREPSLASFGSHGSSTSIAPADGSALADFLASNEDVPGFELAPATSVPGDSPPTLLVDATVDEHSVCRPAAAAVVECEPVDPRQDSVRVRVDDIEMLSVTDPPEKRFLPDGLSPTAEARGLRRLASAKPESVPIPRTVARLDEAADPDTDAALLHALCDVAAVTPGDCTPALPAIRAELERADPVAPRDALTVLRHVATADPGAVAPAADAVKPYLQHDDDGVQNEAAHVVSLLAHHDLDDVRDAIDSLASIVQHDEPGLSHAVYALTAVSRDDPHQLAAIRGRLTTVITDDDYSTVTRSNAIASLGRLVAEEPIYSEALVDDVAELFDAPNAKLRNNAVAFLADVATVHSDLVAPYLDTLTTLAQATDDFTRINATGAIARLADDAPDTITEGLPVFVKRLTDDHPLVRKNACEILGYAAPGYATAALETRVRTDDDPDVRSRAAWALDQTPDTRPENHSELST